MPSVEPHGDVAPEARNRPSGGFTLIEVVVATLILATALVASLAAHASEVRTLTTARNVNIAVELAEDRMSAIEALGGDRLPSVTDSLEAGTFPPPFEGMRWTVETETVLDSELIEVNVVVRWDGGEHELTKLVERGR